MFFLDDALTSYDALTRFNTRTEQLAKCCAPFAVAEGCACKTSLASYFILLTFSRRYFCSGSNCFIFVALIFVLFAPYVLVHI